MTKYTRTAALDVDSFIMEYFIIVTFLAIGVCGQNNNQTAISVTSAKNVNNEHIAEVVTNKNTTTYDINNYNVAQMTSNANSRYSDDDLEESPFGEKLNDSEMIEGTREAYGYRDEHWRGYENDDRNETLQGYTYDDTDEIVPGYGDGIPDEGIYNETATSISSAKLLNGEKVADVIENQSAASDNTNNYHRSVMMPNANKGDRYEQFDILQGNAYDDRNETWRRYAYDKRSSSSSGFGFDDGNPDVHGEIRRPCQAYDTFCIRKFFAEHSNCKISGRAVPDPLYRADQGSSVHFASNNMSQTQVNAYYSGLNNARVSEFYINKVTDNLVIAVTFDSAAKYSNNTYMKYYTRGREPIVTRGVGGIRYSVFTVTVIIPQLRNLRLDRSEIYTYGENDVFPFALGPGIGESTDPEVISMYARFYTNIPVEYQEEISNQGNYMVGNFIQYNICDFGLKVL